MNVLYLVSAGGAAMRRSVRSAIQTAAPAGELRMLAPAAEAKALRDCAVPTESWRPAGLFNVLRAINVLRRAVDRFEPDVIHAFGWTAAAVALGALPGRHAGRTLVTLQDPIRKGEMPKAFLEKRLPELLARSWSVECAYETLRRVLVETLNVPGKKVRLVPYGVAAAVGDPFARQGSGRGPLVGYYSRLESDRGWEIAVDALALVAQRYPTAGLVFGRSGPIAGLVRSHARTANVAAAVSFLDDVALDELFGQIDMLAVPTSFDGLPYVVPEALASGIPLVGADSGGIADTLAPYAGWLVPDTATGFATGFLEAWSQIEAAWSAAQAQRSRATDEFSARRRSVDLRETYGSIAAGATAIRVSGGS